MPTIYLGTYVGWPGSVHDARVFVNSSLYRKAMNKESLQDNIRELNGTNVPVSLIGDAGYPLLQWLLKPFPYNTNLSSQQKNFQLSSVTSTYCLRKCLWALKSTMVSFVKAK